MKKTLMLAAAATLATLSISESASAGFVVARPGLLGLVGRPILVDGLGAVGLVQAVVPLGRIGYGGNCNYIMNWASPFNPNLVTQCVLSETRTALNPSCTWIGDYLPTAVVAGDGFSFCEGFDLMGFPLPVTIIATTVAGCNLVGVICYDGFFSLPVMI